MNETGRDPAQVIAQLQKHVARLKAELFSERSQKSFDSKSMAKSLYTSGSGGPLHVASPSPLHTQAVRKSRERESTGGQSVKDLEGVLAEVRGESEYFRSESERLSLYAATLREENSGTEHSRMTLEFEMY